MSTPAILAWAMAGLFAIGLSAAGHAEIALNESGTVGLYGDVRLRIESDWDSTNSSGAQRDDRTRLRARLRVGLNVKPSENIQVGLRLRSGSDSSHQSPHITLVDFDDNDTGDADFNLDKWFASYTQGSASVWVGRNSLPMWKQNELIWDDDVTPAGVSGTWKLEGFDFTAGYFSLPVGMQEFSGNLALAQVVYRTKIGDKQDDLTLAGGLLAIDGNSSDSDAPLLLDDNGARDYRSWVFSAQYKTTAQERPLAFGFDYIHNSKSYSATDPDPFTAFNEGETDGFVLQASYGATSAGKWLAGYYYADIETLAMSSSYTQDDWMRWGSATETRSTNFSGHELRFGYGLMENMNLIARTYFVDANVRRSAGAAAKEDGNRFRIDLNYRF